MYSFKKICILLLLVLTCFGIAQANYQKKKQSTESKQTKKKSSKKSSTNKSNTKKKTNKKQVSTSKATVSPVAKVEKASLKDTSNPKEVVITSAFKPSLKNAAKINFTAAAAIADTNKLSVNYKIPSQNLFFSYQPVPIKPIALGLDSIESFQNDHFIKLGFGNFSTPFAEVGFSFGDGKKSSIAIHALHVSSKGDLDYQQFSKTGVDILSIFNTPSQHEWTAKAFYNTNSQYFYGITPPNPSLTKDDLLQRYNQVGVELGVQNKQIGNYGFVYHPQIFFNYFANNKDTHELNLIAKLPFIKSFGSIYAFKMGVTADMTSYQAPLNPSPLKINNNLIYIDPTIQFKTPNFKLNLGIQPTWDNQQFSLLPNLTAEARIKETGFNVELGWVGYFQKNTYRTLAGFNPWILSPNILMNTKISEQYLGVKGSAGNHLTYQARLSFLQLYNQALFVNNYADGRSFNILFDPKIQALRLHGELGYSIQEKFSFIGSVNLNQYTSLSDYDKAYGLVPMEITGTFKWKVNKDLQIKADAFLRDGSSYQNKLSQSLKLDPAADVNLGAEFSVMPKLNLWIQMNNLFNNKYQRWNQYEVLGFNVLGGVVYSFK
ncbi:MAG: hypothetical protein NTZ19_06860 [Bacteroidetes bacterium]|nr:hypothetical protein [Bacteroidota bacterium]